MILKYNYNLNIMGDSNHWYFGSGSVCGRRFVVRNVQILLAFLNNSADFVCRMSNIHTMRHIQLNIIQYIQVKKKYIPKIEPQET